MPIGTARTSLLARLRSRRRRLAGNTRYVLGSLWLAGLLALANEAAATPLAQSRHLDPITVDTRLLAELSDRDPAHYRLYVARDGTVYPAPFQVDQRDARGRLVSWPRSSSKR